MQDAAGDGAIARLHHRRLPVHLDRKHAAAAARHPLHLGDHLVRAIDVEEHPVADRGVEGGGAERQRRAVGDADIDQMADAGFAGRAARAIAADRRRRIDGEDAPAGRHPAGELDGEDAGTGADVDDDLAGAQRQEIERATARRAFRRGARTEPRQLGARPRRPAPHPRPSTRRRYVPPRHLSRRPSPRRPAASRPRNKLESRRPI